jgi:hypothetical protein
MSEPAMNGSAELTAKPAAAHAGAAVIVAGFLQL